MQWDFPRIGKWSLFGLNDSGIKEELKEDSTCRKFLQIQTEGNRQVERELPFYNLDMIISLGYSFLEISN